jgi:hypothetical protein
VFFSPSSIGLEIVVLGTPTSTTTSNYKISSVDFGNGQLLLVIHDH